MTPLPVDHYHAFLDPIVFVGAGLTTAGLWLLTARGTSGPLARNLARGLVGAGVAGLLAFNVAIAPPAQSPDGGWNAADVAAQRILMSTGGLPIELRSLPAFKAPDAYGFPLVWFHAQVSGTTDTPTAWTRAAAASADSSGATAGDVPATALSSDGAIVTICDALFIHDCGGARGNGRGPGERLRAGPPVHGGARPHDLGLPAVALTDEQVRQLIENGTAVFIGGAGGL